MGLDAGRLRHRIDIQEKLTEQYSNGDPIEFWVNRWINVPAEVIPLSAKEFIAAKVVQSKITARITIRYRSGLDASMRILFRGKYYDIAGVLPDNKSGLEWITFPVSEGVNEG